MLGTKSTTILARLFIQLKHFWLGCDRRNKDCSYSWNMRISLNFERKCLEKGSFLENWDYLDSDAANKISGSSPQFSFTSVVLHTEIIQLRKSNLQWLRSTSLNIERNQYKEHFLKLKDCQDTDAWNTKKKFSHWKHLYNQKILDSYPDLTEEMQPVILVEKDFKYRD